MGLGLTVRFPVGQNPETNKEFYENYFAGLPSVVPGWETGRYFDEGGFWVKLVPFEEDVYGAWEDGALSVSARTNSAGPGYHAYLVDVLDGLGVAPLEVEDETDYYNHRDFALLQNEMTEWLRGLSSQLIEISSSGEYSNIAVSLPINFLPENSNHFTCCPLGYFEKEFFERVQSGEEAGADFFVWWNRSQDARFFKNAAMNLIWCENNWVLPETKGEQETMAATLECLEKAYQLDKKLMYPTAEWIEIARLSEKKSLEKKLHSRFGALGIGYLGYKRGSISSNVDGWRFSHSGKMHFDREEDGSPVWWDDNRTIRVSIITVQFEEGFENKSEALLRSATENDEGYEPFALRNSEIAAAIQHSQIEENGEPVLQTRLAAALENELLVMSLYYFTEKDRAWAEEVCASVAR